MSIKKDKVSDPMKRAMREALDSVEKIENESNAARADGDLDDGVEIVLDDSQVEFMGAEAPMPVEKKKPPTIDLDAAEAPAAEAETEPEPTAEDKISAMKDQLLRLAADFENFRKRSRREQEELRKYGIENLLRDILPVVDNLERALAHSDAKNPVVQGVTMVQKQFIDVLQGYGVESFSSPGEAFNPERHEAMSQAQVEGTKPGTIVEEMEKGYAFHDRLLRPAKVIVAAAGEPANAAKTDDAD